MPVIPTSRSPQAMWPDMVEFDQYRMSGGMNGKRYNNYPQHVYRHVGIKMKNVHLINHT